MRRLQYALLTIVSVIGFASIASAADMRVKAPVTVAPPYNWSGVYVGISGGYGWDKLNWTNAAGVTSGDFNGRGGLFGATLGANYQFPGTAFVVGVEGDWSWANIHASTFVAACGVTSGCQTDVKSLGTIRGRLGYAIDRLLVYGTAGAAFAKFHPFSTGFGGFTDYNDSGWTAGGGLEYAFYDRWSVKAEFLHMNFGTSPIFFAGTGITSPFKMSVARIGLNYRFW